MFPDFLRNWVIPRGEVEELIRSLNRLHAAGNEVFMRDIRALEEKLERKQKLCDMMLLRGRVRIVDGQPIWEAGLDDVDDGEGER